MRTDTTLRRNGKIVRVPRSEWDEGASSVRSKELAKVQMFRWGPLKGSASHYPPGFGLEMFAVTSPGAGRYFLSGPGGDAAFLRTVSFGGLVILNRIAKLCKEQRFSYRIMGLISQMGPKLQEHFSRASGVEVEVCRHVIDTLHMRNGIRTIVDPENWTTE